MRYSWGVSMYYNNSIRWIMPMKLFFLFRTMQEKGTLFGVPFFLHILDRTQKIHNRL